MELGPCFLTKERRVIRPPLSPPLIQLSLTITWNDYACLLDMTKFLDLTSKIVELETKIGDELAPFEPQKKKKKRKKKLFQMVDLRKQSRYNYVNHLPFYAESQKHCLAQNTLDLAKDKKIFKQSTCDRGSQCRDRRLGHLANFSHCDSLCKYTYVKAI